MKARLAAAGIAVATMAIVLYLFLPLGCWIDDRGPGVPGDRRGECPQSPSRIGVLWPNGSTGLFGAAVLSQLTGWGAGAYAWRRLVPRRTAREPGKLTW